MAATALSLLAVGLSSAEPYGVRSTPNPNHRRSILFNSELKHFKHASFSPNFIFKHSRPRASTASGDTDIVTNGSSTVSFANDDVIDSTLFVIRARNRIGLLQVITRVFNVLGLTVERATIEFEGDFFSKNFHVTNSDGKKIEGVENLERIRKALMEAIDGGGNTDASGGSMQASGRGVVVRKSVPGLESLGERRGKAEKMFGLMDGFLKNDPVSLQKDILDHVEYTVARSRFSFDDFEAFQALSHSVRDRLIERWHDTHQHFKKQDPKRLYFLSLEFLMGRSLSNSVINLGIRDEYEEALSQLGFEFEVLAEQEGDAALGNGGLARLSACQMDSLATLDYPVWGYGLRYQYGLFRQIIVDGYQHEQPDYWLNFGNPWEIERIQVSYSVKFYGTVEEKVSNGAKYNVWTPGETIEAVAYDNPIPGYGTRNAINLRLWAAKPSGQYDLESYNTGDYIKAIVDSQKAESISNVLYPDDRSYQGKELRLKQQYFFVSASVQDVIRRFKDVHDNFDEFPDKVAFQINDTHPSLAIAEVMRILIDEECLEWNRAWEIVCQTFSFTTHTINTEGLEKIPVDLLGSLLPRHLQIMYDINQCFMEELKRKIGQDYSRIERMSIVEEGIVKSIRMANLSIICCHTVNGVSRTHFELIKTRVFKDFYDLWPQKFHFKTNGVTQRRWIVVSNPSLCSLISKWLETEAWIRHVDLLAGLREHASDPVLQQEWRMVKKVNKMRLAEYIETLTGVKVSLDAMFDVQIKRIHEYKRQLLNILGIVYRYDCIKNMSKSNREKVVPRVCIIGGKAAPGYEVAKKIIKLCHAVADKINNDADVGDLLKVVFIPDYNVSVAELVIPGSDLSQHISTAGHEASGTGSMKFLMNGCLLLATADGSTIEIIEEIGVENMFLFGAKVHEVSQLRDEPSHEVSIQFNRVVRMVRDGYFGFKEYFKPLCDSLEDGNDFYLLGADFSSYLEAQEPASIRFIYEEDFILNSRGMKLFTCSWKPALPEPKGLIFLCHGYGMECSVSFRSCGIRLAKAGYAVYGIDYEGHGKSSGLRCYIPNFDDLVNDCSDHFTSIYERRENRNIKKILMGESMGGAVALLLHMKKPSYWDMAVLVAPMCKIAEELKPHPVLIRLSLMLVHLIPTWKITPAANVIDASFRVPEIKDEIRANPLCYKGRVRLATATEIWKTSLDLESRLQEVSLSFLVIHGGQDRVIDPSVSRLLCERAKSSDKTFKLYPDMWHSLTCGELPENIDIVFTDIISWLDERLA